MDAVGSVCLFVIVVCTCIIVVNGCLDSTSKKKPMRKTRCYCNVITIIINASDIDVVVGYIKPFYFVRTMDTVGSVCFFVIVVCTCIIVVNGGLDSTSKKNRCGRLVVVVM
jgi:hypothetical protein